MQWARRQLRTGTVVLDDEGFVRYEYPAGATLSLADAELETQAALELTNNGPYHALVDLRGLKRVDAKARRHYASSPGMQAAAMLVDRPISRVLGNFFLGINRPAFPVKLFNAEQQALRWLRSVARAR